MSKLLYVASATAGGSDTTLSVTGINSDDVYVVYCYDMYPATDTATTYFRVTKSGTQDTASSYTYGMDYNADLQNTGQAQSEGLFAYSAVAGKRIVFRVECYNFNSSSKKSFATVSTQIGTNFFCYGGFVHEVTSASDGLGIFPNTGNVAAGSMLVLYNQVAS